jgi:hypothetical protein
MKVIRPIAGGLAGGMLAIAIIRGAAWVTGADADICAILGAVVTGSSGIGAWLVGCAVQLTEAVVVAIVYAVIFEGIARRAGALLGLLLAIPLVVVAGLSMGFLPGARLLDAGIAPPGAFMEYCGAAVIVGFVLAHLAFGIVVGMAYGQTLHAVPPTLRVWHDMTIVDDGDRAKV